MNAEIGPYIDNNTIHTRGKVDKICTYIHTRPGMSTYEVPGTYKFGPIRLPRGISSGLRTSWAWSLVHPFPT